MNLLMSSGELAASAVVSNAPGAVACISVTADGTNTADVTLYDSATAASGTVLAHVVVPANSKFDMLHLTVPCQVLNGIYASVSGTGAKCVVYFYKG